MDVIVTRVTCVHRNFKSFEPFKNPPQHPHNQRSIFFNAKSYIRTK